MRIVVTGASGNIGTALLRAAAADGWDVVGIARRRPDTSQPPYCSARWIESDLGVPDATPMLADLFAGSDAVVHLAWAINPHRDEPPMRRTNHVGSANVLRAAFRARAPHLVCASSVAAYSPAGRCQRVDEGWPRGGVAGSAYSAGKASLEADLDSFSRLNPRTRVARVRPCAVVQDDAAAQFWDWLLPPWLPRRLFGFRGLPLPLWPGLRLQVVHADDVAQAIRLILIRRATGAFNVAAEPLLGREELAGIVGGTLVPVPLSLLTRAAKVGWRFGLQPLHPAWLRLADRVALVRTHRLRDELGWSPRHSSREVVTDLVSAMRAGHHGVNPPLRPHRGPVGFGRPSHQDQAP